MLACALIIMLGAALAIGTAKAWALLAQALDSARAGDDRMLLKK